MGIRAINLRMQQSYYCYCFMGVAANGVLTTLIFISLIYEKRMGGVEHA